MKSPVSLLSSLLMGIKRMDPSVKGLDRDYVTAKHRVEHEGLSFLTVTLCSLGDALDKGLSSGTFLCPSSFKKKKGSALPAFTQGLLSKVFDVETGNLRADPDVSAITELRQLYRLFKKTAVSSSRTERLENEATELFLETEERVVDYRNCDSRRRYLLSAVSRCFMPNLESFRIGPIRSRHGPGAVYESVKGNSKWAFLTKMLMDGTFDPIDTDLDLFAVVERSFSTIYHTQSSSGMARLVFVPKSATAVRTITVEPCLKQFVQQGLNRVLRDSISRCSILSTCLDLNSQVPNQKLALEGSITGEYATIDLKSASDLLSLGLVEAIFESKPSFLEALLRSRSTHVEFRHMCLALRKFAGMGNATTFPVQSIAFATLCICAILEQDGKAPTYWNIRNAARTCQVFGDDIIIKTRYVDTLYSWLTEFGLKVNFDKSFTEGNFRESCGVDAFRGYDVTPVYIRVDTRSTTFTPNDIASIVSTSNQFWMKAHYELAQALTDLAEKHVVLPLVRKDSGLLGLHSRVDASEAHTWDKKRQVLAVCGYRLSSRKVKDRLDGYAALLKFFMTPLIERGVKHLEVSQVRYKSRLVKARVPA